jgi:hypothetical protein
LLARKALVESIESGSIPHDVVGVEFQSALHFVLRFAVKMTFDTP